MVKGLSQFKEYFAPFGENYVLIGGVACMLAMEEKGLDFGRRKISILFSALKRSIKSL